VSGKSTPETCGKQVENLSVEIEEVVRELGWVVRAHVDRKTPARLPVEWQVSRLGAHRFGPDWLTWCGRGNAR